MAPLSLKSYEVGIGVSPISTDKETEAQRGASKLVSRRSRFVRVQVHGFSPSRDGTCMVARKGRQGGWAVTPDQLPDQC